MRALCNVYVLERNLSSAGRAPYRLNCSDGDTPKSSISLVSVRFGSVEVGMRLLVQPPDCDKRFSCKVESVTKEAVFVRWNSSEDNGPPAERGLAGEKTVPEPETLTEVPKKHWEEVTPTSEEKGGVLVTFRNGRRAERLKLENYLDIPQPRTRQLCALTRMLAEQHPEKHLDPAIIDHIDCYGGQFKKFQ